MTEDHPFARARAILLRHRTDVAAARRDFRWPALDTFNWALDWFDPYARGNQRLALRIVDESGAETSVTYDALARRSSQVANHLRAAGVRRGDRVLVMLPNDAAIWETVLACIKLGAVVIPSTPQLTADDIDDRAGRGDVRHAVTDLEGAAKLDRLPAHVTRILVDGERPGWSPYAAAANASETFVPDGVTRATDPLLLYFTSGTTARPKLVLHTHQSYPVGHLSTMYWLGIQEGDVHWNISSPGWAKHAWSSFFAPFNAGATILVFRYKRFAADQAIALLDRAGVNVLCAPPTVWRMLLLGELGPRPRALRELASAGEPLNPEVIERVQAAWGITIRDGFGQTETTAVVGNPPGQPVKPGSMGCALPGYEVVLLDADGRPGAREGEVALDLRARPLGLMVGYLDDPARNAAATAAGHYRTGDEATIDDDGYIHFVGRGDDVFKSSDYRISPFELESVLVEHPAIAEAAVVPSPDPVRLAVPKAFIVLRPEAVACAALAHDIFGHVNARLAPYKRIRRLEFADLPKTISGKIRRVALRNQERDRRAAGTRGPAEHWSDDARPES